MKSNTIILIISTLVVAGGAYWYYSSIGEELPLTTSLEQNESEVRFQTLASQLKPISFKTGIFSKPEFLSLVDLSVTATPETIGRLDPFAPISGTTEE
jgi:hypothetical protein